MAASKAFRPSSFQKRSSVRKEGGKTPIVPAATEKGSVVPNNLPERLPSTGQSMSGKPLETKLRGDKE
jgi:hypothetical protein